MRTENIFTQMTHINTTIDVVLFSNTTCKRVISSFTVKTQYRQFSNITNNLRPQVLTLKEKGSENKKNSAKSRSFSFFKTTAQVIQSQLNNGNLSVGSQSIEEIKNISFPVDLHKNENRFKKRKLLKAYLTQLQLKKLNAIKFTFKLKNRLLNRKTKFSLQYAATCRNKSKLRFLFRICSSLHFRFLLYEPLYYISSPSYKGHTDLTSSSTSNVIKITLVGSFFDIYRN
ncbi:hypothetical protein ACTFIV_003258 [Dictyostelium citrinum]